jgi:hypothetical protein
MIGLKLKNHSAETFSFIFLGESNFGTSALGSLEFWRELKFKWWSVMFFFKKKQKLEKRPLICLFYGHSR